MIRHIFLQGLFFLTSSFSQAQDVDLFLNLKAYYPFSGNAEDASGHNRHGEIHGNPTLTTDRFGNADSAYEFDGVDDLINTQSIFNYSNRSLSLWINPYDINGFNTTAKVAITQDSDYLSSGTLRVEFNNSGMKLWAGGVSGTYPTTDVAENEWIHLLLVRQDTVVKYYINAEMMYTSVADSLGSTHNPNPIFIIGSGRSLNDQFFRGKIDEIRIYDRVLNKNEINSLYKGDLTSAQELTSANSINYRIFPLPSSGTINVELDAFYTDISVSIYDVSGRLIRRNKENASHIGLDISTFPRGDYFLRLSTNSWSILKKIQKI